MMYVPALALREQRYYYGALEFTDTDYRQAARPGYWRFSAHASIASGSTSALGIARQHREGRAGWPWAMPLL